MTDSATCAHCSVPLAPSDQFCTACGTPRAAVERSRRRRQAPIGAPSIASPITVATALAVDLLAALLASALGVVAVGAAGALLGIVVVLAQTAALLWWGRSVGWRALGLRLVTDSTGSPPGFRRGTLLIADIKRGPDPVDPFITPPALPSPAVRFTPRSVEPARQPTAAPLTPARETLGQAAVESPGRMPATAVEDAIAQLLPDAASATEDLEVTVLRPSALRAGGTILVLDGDRRLPMTPRMLIGRNPDGADGVTVVAIPDLSRELSKSHLLIEQDPDGSVFVTDLQSTNGTTVNGVLVRSDVRIPVSHGSTISAGGHTVQVLSRIRAEHGAMV